MSERFVAIDLGASSGRVMVAEVGPAGGGGVSHPVGAEPQLTLTELHRFANEPVRTPDGLHWDILKIYAEIKTGLRKAAAGGAIRSIGIDSWAVDFGLLDDDGRLLANPVHYRDSRTDDIGAAVHDVISKQEFYDRTGLQYLPFNTVYQLASLRGSAQLAAARTLLLIPDLLGYWLTGEIGAEFTNASTTQLLDVRTGQWALDLVRRLDLPEHLLPPVRRPGAPIGTLRSELAAELGIDQVPVVAVGSHDTASAVLAVPASEPNFCYIASGTWSLVGQELSSPVLSEASRSANFSNEGGVDSTVRYLRNVMGLWLLQQCQATWYLQGREPDLPQLLLEAASLPALESFFDCDQAVFLPPGDMPAQIAAACATAGLPVPVTDAQFVRTIVDSLALEYRRVVRLAVQLSGCPVEVVHIVGGGSQNTLLCQLSADALGMPVIAGPVEASALGNVLVQARAAGVVGGEVGTLRALIARSQELRRYQPDPDAEKRWQAAADRLAGR